MLKEFQSNINIVTFLKCVYIGIVIICLKFVFINTEKETKKKRTKESKYFFSYKIFFKKWYFYFLFNRIKNFRK